MPRLFFAIRTSDAQREELQRVQREIAQQLDTLGANYKLENLQNSHCTLRFLGNVFYSHVQPLIESARARIKESKVKPFELPLGELGTFSNRGRTRVIWAGLANAPELTTLRAAVDWAAITNGIFFEHEEAFHPHLTLIRFREPFRLPEDFTMPKMQPMSQTVREIELVQSKTLATGAVHEVIARFEL